MTRVDRSGRHTTTRDDDDDDLLIRIRLVGVSRVYIAQLIFNLMRNKPDA